MKTRSRLVSGPPVAALRVWLGSGERSAQRPGEAVLAGRLLEEGSATRDWRRIAEDAETRGIAIAAAGGYEVLALAIDGPATELGRMIDWAAELALTSTLETERWEWHRELASAELAALSDEPEVVTGLAALRQLYGDHPRGRPLIGTQESLERVEADDSRRAYASALRGRKLAAVAGAIEEGEAARSLEAAFGDPETEGETSGAGPDLNGQSEDRVVVELPGDQAHLVLGRVTVERDHPDLPALEAAGVVLGAGAGLAGRIPMRVREQEGLAYSVGVDTAAGATVDPGRLIVQAATSPSRLERAELVIREELERFATSGPSEAEFEEARSFLEGREAFRRETARQVADLLIEAEFTGLSIDRPDWGRRRWRHLTVEAVRDAAERWLDPACLCVTIGRPR